MSAFAVVRDIDHLDLFGPDLGAFAQVLRAASGAPYAEPILGIWVEHTPAAQVSLLTPAALSGGSEAAVTMTVEIGGRWAVCATAPHASSREAVLDLLVRREPGAPRGLFVPVYSSHDDPRQRDIDWHGLAARFPGRVLPLMVQDGSGAITFRAPTASEERCPQVSALA